MLTKRINLQIVLALFFTLLLIPRLHYYFYDFQDYVSKAPGYIMNGLVAVTYLTLAINFFYLKKHWAFNVLLLMLSLVAVYQLNFSLDAVKICLFFLSIVYFNTFHDQFFINVDQFLKIKFSVLVTILALMGLATTYTFDLWQDGRNVGFVGNPVLWGLILLIALTLIFVRENKQSEWLIFLISSVLIFSILKTKAKLPIGLCYVAIFTHLAYHLKSNFKNSLVALMITLFSLTAGYLTNTHGLILQKKSNSYTDRYQQFQQLSQSFKKSRTTLPFMTSLAVEEKASPEFTLPGFDNQFMDFYAGLGGLFTFLSAVFIFYSLYISFKTNRFYLFIIQLYFIIFLFFYRFLVYYPLSTLYALFISTGFYFKNSQQDVEC